MPANQSPWTQHRHHFSHTNNQEANKGDAQSLNMENVNGVFFVLLGGCVFGIVLGIIRALLECFRSSRKVKVFPHLPDLDVQEILNP